MPIASAFGPLLLSPLLGPPASGLSGLGTGRLGSAGLKHSASASRRQGYEHLELTFGKARAIPTRHLLLRWTCIARVFLSLLHLVLASGPFVRHPAPRPLQQSSLSSPRTNRPVREGPGLGSAGLTADWAQHCTPALPAERGDAIAGHHPSLLTHEPYCRE